MSRFACVKCGLPHPGADKNLFCPDCRPALDAPIAPLPLSVGIARLSLQPGDVLVAHVPKHATSEQLCATADLIRSALPKGIEVLACNEDCTFTVLRAGQPVTPTVDEAVAVAVPRG